MIKQKKKICLVCKDEKYIWSKGRCKTCASSSYKTLSSTSTLKSNTPIKKITKKTQKARKKQRKDYPEFFKKHINIIITEGRRCEECNDKLKGGVDEVAHILSKSIHPEVATEDNNVIYLCGVFSNNKCHYKFDNGDRQNMKVFNTAKEKYKLIKNKINKISKETLLLEK